MRAAYNLPAGNNVKSFSSDFLPHTLLCMLGVDSTSGEHYTGATRVRFADAGAYRQAVA